MTVYDPTVWVNGVPPAVNATNLNKIENGIDTAHSELAAHIADAADPHSVTKTQVGLSNVANIKVKLDATTAPTVTDDSNSGYGVQSRWTDVTLDKEYVCLDASVGAAVWTEVTGGAAHDLGGASHNVDTLANLNSKVSDATLIDTADGRLSDDRDPTAHATEHVDGTDDIRDATNALKGLTTPAQITALEANSTHKTSDGSDHTFIDQSVISGASPTFNGANITDIDADTLIADVKEANVSAVTKGQMCAIVGSSGNKFEVQLCDCDDANLIRALGLVMVDTAQNETGQVVHKGLLTNVDTQIGNTDVNPNGETWAAGDMLFVSNTPGGLTNVRPSVGRCIKAGRTLKGNSASDILLAIVHTNDISACAAAGEDLCNRMGDNDGVNKCSFKDYANNEIAAFDSNGNLTLIGNVDGIDVATDVAANTAKDTNVTTNLSEGTNTETTVDVNSSDGTNATLVSASTVRAGLLTKAKFDEIVANTAKTTNATHTGDVTGDEELTIAADSVTYDKMQDASATDKILGRSTAGAGTIEEIACTAAGRALLDDTDTSTQRTTLGVAIGTDVPAESDMTAVENRTTAIENDIDYSTAVKQKAIVDTDEDGGVEGGVFNGDFEYGSGSKTSVGWIGDKKYGWYALNLISSAKAEYDDTVSYNGSQSLKLSTLDVTGKALISLHPNYTAHSAKKYSIPIIPSTRYRISCMMKGDNLAVDSGYIEFKWFDSNGSIVVQSTSPKKSGTFNWEYVELLITSPATAQFLLINPYISVAGNVSAMWFDDIKLEQIDTQAVNTQVDEPVSVSIEGVTTTDNIDQYLETSGNTYTLTTSINEGATHRQTFTPTADRGDGKHILTKIQALVTAVGAGDWTLVVHDVANNILASTTIAVGSMSTGDIDFNVPAILDVGTAYHFHIYSTVADGTVTTTDNADLETVDFHAQFAKHTESPVISANGGTLDMTGVKLLTGATITVNADGSGRYEYNDTFQPVGQYNFVSDILESSHETFRTSLGTPVAWGLEGANLVSTASPAGVDKSFTYKINFGCIITNIKVSINALNSASGASSLDIYTSLDNVIFTKIGSHTLTTSNIRYESHGIINNDAVYIKFIMVANIDAYGALDTLIITADLDCQAALPIFIPSSEVAIETSDLTQNPIDISEDGYWQLNSDLTGWGSRTFTMLASEAAFESQAVSANYIYMYDSNGTTPWTWDERSGLVPPADRTSGTVTTKFLVGDNQIRSSVNDGSMKANVNLSWNEESLRAAINRLTALANLQYPIVIEVEDVPAIDLQDQPTGADAETGYTNDVTSLRQSAAGAAAIAYTGLLPRENQFTEWRDITVTCSDGDGTLQGKLYTVDGTLIETYADLESNPVIEISNPDYKYSRERLILQISASVETTTSAWSVTDIKWRYQYDG